MFSTRIPALFALPLVGLVLAGCGGTDRDAAMEPNRVLVQLETVTVAYPDTPGGAGLYETAVTDARVAAEHAQLADIRPDDLDWMKMHAAHVLNAIAPDLAPAGPGTGFGLERAVRDIDRQVGLASRAPGANQDVRAHAGHVATSLGNVAAWSEQVRILAQAVTVASQPEEAARKVDQMVTLTNYILAGFDADGDGTITWQRSEGGMAQVEQHLTLMAGAAGA